MGLAIDIDIIGQAINQTVPGEAGEYFARAIEANDTLTLVDLHLAIDTICEIGIGNKAIAAIWARLIIYIYGYIWLYMAIYGYIIAWLTYYRRKFWNQTDLWKGQSEPVERDGPKCFSKVEGRNVGLLKRVWRDLASTWTNICTTLLRESGSEVQIA